jgi:hypothetical protein
VAARREPAGGPGGGAGIPAPRPSRARLIPALASVAAASTAAGYAATIDGRYEALAQPVAVAGVAVLVLALARRWTGLVAWAIALVAAGYVIARASHDTVDGWAAVVGALLLAAAELAFWSIEADPRIHEERAVVVRRVTTLVALLAGSALLGMLVVSAAAVSGASNVLAAAVGVAAAVAAVALVLRLLRGI